MAAPRKSTRYIGLCPVCMREIKVRKGALVHHGFERPGHGFIVGDCFGVGYPPYEVSAQGAVAWHEYVVAQISRVRKELKALPNVEVLYEQKYERDRKTGRGRYIPVPVRKGEGPKYKWDWLYEQAEHKLQSQLQGLESEAERTQKMIDDWEAQPLRTVEESVAEKKKASGAKQAAKEEQRRKKIEAKVAYYHKRLASLQKRLEKARGKLSRRPDERQLQWDVQMLERDIEDLPENAVRKLRDMSGFRGGKYGMSKEEALEMLGWTTPPQVQTRKLKNKLLR